METGWSTGVEAYYLGRASNGDESEKRGYDEDHYRHWVAAASVGLSCLTGRLADKQISR